MKLLDKAYEAFLAHMERRKFPACFDSRMEFEGWCEVEAISHTKPRLFPCRDCANEYHSQMVSEGRCALAGLPNAHRLFNKGT